MVLYRTPPCLACGLHSRALAYGCHALIGVAVHELETSPSGTSASADAARARLSRILRAVSQHTAENRLSAAALATLHGWRHEAPILAFRQLIACAPSHRLSPTCGAVVLRSG